MESGANRTGGSDSDGKAGTTGSAKESVGENDAWGMVATLVAGPVTWGLIGAGADLVLGLDRVLLGVGVAIGFVTSLYIVYVRYGRS